MRTREMQAPALLIPLLIAVLAPANVIAQEGPTAVQEAPAPEAPVAPSRVVTGGRTIAEGEVVDEIVVVGGDLRVEGEVTGNAVVVGGDLILRPTGAVLGDAVVTGGRLLNEGGRVRGEMRTIQGPGLDIAREIERVVEGGTIAVEPSRSVAPEAPAASTRSRQSSRGWPGFNRIRRGISGIFSTLAFGLVLAGVGATLIFYGRSYLETVSDTIRGATLRSGATGLAASFLILPAFVILVVALAVSIVGIPFLLAAVPLYPLAIFAAAVFGLLGAAHAIGERTAEQSRDSLEMRYRNSYAYLFTGLGMLLLPHVAAHLLSMTGFLGFIGGLLRVVTVLAIFVSATVGFGAVILSRGGTRRTFVPPPPDTGFVSDNLSDDLFDEPIASENNG